MSILRLSIFVLLTSCTLAGCVSKNTPHAYERRNELYESIANPGTRLVYQTARYLQRTPLHLDSQDIPAGVYKPTEFYAALSNSSNCSLNSMNIMDAILTGKTSAYARSQDTLPPIPVEKTPLEIMNAQARSSPPEFLNRVPTRSPQVACQECDSQLGGGCDDIWSNTVQSDLELANLTYVVVVNNPKKCCNWQTQPRSRDLNLLLAQKEGAQYKASAAATIYDNSEILKLLQLLPVKYRSVADVKLELPPSLSDFVGDVLKSTSSVIASRFSLPEQRKAEITFDITQMDPTSLIDYGGWYQSLSNENDAKVYVAPLLARAPFYICYNQGVEQFLRSRSNLITIVSRNGWRSLSDGDIISIAETHVEFNDDFKNCVTTQLAFIFGHEIGHKYILKAGEPPPDSVLVERIADCFGLANAKLGGRFDPFVFENLVAADPTANISSIARLKLRIEKIHEMNTYFEASAPPKDGKHLVSVCRKLVLDT